MKLLMKKWMYHLSTSPPKKSGITAEVVSSYDLE